MVVGIAFISAELETTWIEDIISDVLKNLPSELFGESRTWHSLITHFPFIHTFTIAQAKKIVFRTREERVLSNETIFPKDGQESEENFMQFIESKPLRIMIAGNENPSLFRIGELLVNEVGSHHITPVQLIYHQITRQTQIGKWLYWNIEEKRGIPIWVVMKLLEEELKNDKYAHKGFILTGFPIIPDVSSTFGIPCEFRNDVDYALEHEFHEDKSVHKFTEEEFYAEEEAETISYCSSSSSILSNIMDQVDLYSSFENREFILLDGDEDVIVQNCVQKQLDSIYNLWCRPTDLIYLDTIDYTEQYVAIANILQNFFLFYYREDVIQVDCRIGIKAILKSICNRFKYKYYKVNYPCNIVQTHGNSKMSLEELCNTNKVLPNCKWWVSKFERVCPVNLYFGRRRICDSKFPVIYLKYIFLCHSSKDRQQFIVNPGKYMRLLPTCRVAVIGPHRTGKTTLSQYLARYFKADVYRAHIEKAEINTKKKAFKDKTLLKEFKDLDALRLQDYDNLKKRKIEEWITCVFAVVNEAFSKEFNLRNRTRARFNLFNTEQANRYFFASNKRSVSDVGIKRLILENAVFNKSIQGFISKDFINWVSVKPKSHHLYRQYVLDSAPLDITFWDELMGYDELPDCVFFVKTPSIKKMFDLYSLAHDETCINSEMIFEKICKEFSDWRTHFEYKSQGKPMQQNRMDESTLKYIKHLVASRWRDSFVLIEKYKELQLYFQDHNVACIEIDISKQSWTHSISKTLVEYLSRYQAKARALYETYLHCLDYLADNENEEQEQGSISSNLYNEVCEKEKTTEIDLWRTPSINYGYCLDWCPVLLNNNNVLLKGDMRFAAEYKNKVYVMHSKAALYHFLENPMIFSQTPPVVPPPRVFIMGINHTNKVYFAEKLAARLNVENVTYTQKMSSMRHNSYFCDNFSYKAVSDFYDEVRTQYIEDLGVVYKKGAVIFGFPYLFKQFNDAIAKNLYPECIFIIDDQEQVVRAMVRHFLKSNEQSFLLRNSNVGSQNLSWGFVRDPSIVSDFPFLSERLKHEIEERCKLIIQPFVLEVQQIEDACQKLRIPVIKMPNDFKHLELIDFYADQINQYRERAAIFEDIQVITMKESEILLNAGYYRYSRFKRSCPVDVSRLITVNHFEGMRRKGCVYPCVYRDFIYFICGKRNLSVFKRNPSQFVNTCNPPQMLNPMRIAVIGAAKSGVTTICQSMSEELGLKIFSPRDLPYGPVTNTTVIDLFKKNRSVTSNGFILDNIPLTPSLLLEATYNTVDLHIVIILVNSFKKILENWSSQSERIKNCPSLSLAKVYHSFCETQKLISSFRKSTEISLFNIHYMDGDGNSWTNWENVKHEIIKTSRNISGYRIKLLKNRCANLGNLNLFYNAVVFRREINYEYCQSCLALGKMNAFKYFYVDVGQQFYSQECQTLFNRPYGYLNDEIYKQFKFSRPFHVNELFEPLTTQKKYVMGMFQYRDIFYWTCNDHSIDFMMFTSQYFNDREKLKPLHIPFLVMGYTKESVAFQGYCPVEYEQARRVPVPDERFDFLCDYHKPVSKVPAYLNVVDIAGLVKGAAEGQGLGNAFLSHISGCDAIFHLARAFEDTDVTHVEGEVDPVRDLDIISEELRLKDEEKLVQYLDKLEKVVARGGDKKLKPEYDSLLKVKTILIDEKRHLRFAEWNVHDIETLNKYMFLTSKPVIYLVNLSDKDFIRKKNKWLAKIKDWVDKNDPGAIIIPFSGHFEQTLADKDESESKAYEEETKCKSVLDKIIVTGYNALQLEYFFTAGPDEVKAWTIQKGTKAPQAAGRIHTDFEKGFIMAEVMHFKDFKEEGSEAAAKSAGKYRQQGRNYVVEDGDIIFFKFNAGAGLKDAKKK